MRHLVATLFFLIFSNILHVYGIEIDGINYNISGDEAMVIQWTFDDTKTYSGDVVIPESVTYDGKDYSVTSISSYAFKGCDKLTSITIPNSVTTIGYGAFKDCSCLSAINLAPSVVRIYHNAFSGTPWYDNLPDGMVYVGKVAYKYKGEMPEGTHLSIKEGTLSITEQAFALCSGLVSVTIPEGITTIEELAFGGCSSLVSVKLPESLTSIGSSVFYDCVSLSSIDIPSGITKIGSGAFARCRSLTSIAIPEGSWYIYPNTFSGCDNLADVVLPESLRNIDSFAFMGCSGLQSIVCNAPAPPSYGQLVFYGVEKQNCKLYVPKGCEEAYRNAGEWKDFNIIEMGTGISEMQNERVKSEKYDNAIYDLQGRKVIGAEANSSLFTLHSSLKKGLYIVNGRKIAVK